MDRDVRSEEDDLFDLSDEQGDGDPDWDDAEPNLDFEDDFEEDTMADDVAATLEQAKLISEQARERRESAASSDGSNMI